MTSDSELFEYIETHPKVIEAKRLAREEFLNGKKRTSSKKTVKKGDTNDFFLITDYTKASAVLTSKLERIDEDLVSSIREMMKPNGIKYGLFKLSDSGPDSHVKFHGYVLSIKNIDKLRKALQDLNINTTEVPRKSYGFILATHNAQSDMNDKTTKSDLVNEEESGPSTSAPSTSSALPRGTKSSCDLKTNDGLTATKDSIYGNFIVTDDIFFDFNLVVVRADPFGIRIVGRQNNEVSPIFDNPLLTVEPLTPELIRQIREKSKTAPILDKSMIKDIKDLKVRNALKSIYKT